MYEPDFSETNIFFSKMVILQTRLANFVCNKFPTETQLTY